ncbi:MAG: GDP-L-fucose synthase [Verrucomicrobiota bacterium]
MKKKIFIAGHRGLVGSAIHRRFSSNSNYEVVVRTRQEVDLLDFNSVQKFFDSEKPDQVILAAAKVGGIKANWDFPVDFLLQNLKIQNNVIENAYRIGVQKLLFLGSSCIYPKHAPQPIQEESLLTSPLEKTNETYAIAKIAGLKLCQAYARQYGAKFISAMPTNMYGPFDNFDPETSHVLPGLIYKFHAAKVSKANEVVLWGTGTPKREFLHSDDLATACELLLEHYDSPEVINVGCGEDLEIRELAFMIQTVIGFEGQIIWDSSKPDGTPRKILDVNKIKGMGWAPKVSLESGIRDAYDWYLKNRVKS